MCFCSTSWVFIYYSGLGNTGAEPRFCQGWGEWEDSEAESCWRSKVESCMSEASYLQLGLGAHLMDPAGFWVFNAQLCILPHSLILTSSSSPPKADKIVYVLHCTSINLWYFDILHQQGCHLTWKTWKTWKNESTPGKPGNIMEFMKNSINIMENDMKPGKTWWLLNIHPWLPWNNTKFTKLLK